MLALKKTIEGDKKNRPNITKVQLVKIIGVVLTTIENNTRFLRYANF